MATLLAREKKSFSAVLHRLIYGDAIFLIWTCTTFSTIFVGDND